MSALIVLHLLAAGQVSPAAPPPDVPPAQEEWYGWQTLISDGAAAAMLTTGLVQAAYGVSGGSTLIGGSLLIYGLGAPVLHVANGRWWVGLLDVGLRYLMVGAGAVVAALAGLFSGLLQSDADAAFARAIIGLEVGAGAGGVAGSAIDAIWFARKPAPAAQPATASALRWAPFAGAVRGAPVAGLAGRF